MEHTWSNFGRLELQHEHQKPTALTQNIIAQAYTQKDKDITLIKNWRPITLSNCDHKLNTRLYNNRILKAIENEITCTQIAYIKGRNISDNLRLFEAAVRLADNEDDINATVIALDAQKAFDSVNQQ